MVLVPVAEHVELQLRTETKLRGHPVWIYQEENTQSDEDCGSA